MKVVKLILFIVVGIFPVVLLATTEEEIELANKYSNYAKSYRSWYDSNRQEYYDIEKRKLRPNDTTYQGGRVARRQARQYEQYDNFEQFKDDLNNRSRSSTIYTDNTLKDFYIGFGVGGIARDVAYKMYPENISRNYTLSNKFIVDIFIGYEFNDNFALEIEANYIPYSELILGAVDNPYIERYEQLANIFLNGVFKYNLSKKDVPFIKIGFGEMVDIIKEGPSTGDIAGLKEYSYGMAYKIGVGYEYKVTNQQSLLVSYNYVGMLQSNNYKNEYEDPQSLPYENTFSYSNIQLEYKYSFK